MNKKRFLPVLLLTLLLCLSGCGQEPQISYPSQPEQPTEIPATQAGEQDQYKTDPVPEGKPQPVEPQNAQVTDNAYTCTLSISCATILDNMDLVEAQKKPMVPADGWLLAESTVTF